MMALPGRKPVPEVAANRIPAIAAELNRYLSWRAEQEQQTYGLAEAFFAGALRRGVRKFFGVEVNGRGVATDRQRPDLWMRWLNQ
jgi:hypothetical protein